MKATETSLLSLIKGPRQFTIPIYQRTYSWKKEQCQQLWNDILRMESDSKINSHFIGSVVYFKPEISVATDVSEFLVIDGQQRLTTISLMLAAVADFLEENPDAIPDTKAQKIRNYYLLNTEEEDELHYKLVLARADKDTFFHLIRNVAPPIEKSERIIENYTFFRDKINATNAATLYQGMQKLIIVQVALEKGVDNPQLIFESLNSTGLDLSQADLIRNYLLMGLSSKVQKRMYEDYWYPMEVSFEEHLDWLRWLFRDYLTMKTGVIPVINGIYDAYKTYFQANYGLEKVEEALKDLCKYSQYYLRRSALTEKDAEIRSAFKGLSDLKSDVATPLVMAIYNDYENGLINKSGFVRILKLIESYLFRRAICGIPTNSLNKTFATFYKEIRKDAFYVDSVIRLFNVKDSYKRFPNDNEFTNAFRTHGIYNVVRRTYLFDKLENLDRKERVNVNEYTIEHIMPQNPNVPEHWKAELGENWENTHNIYLHTIGNLTLTAYNSEMSDRPFAEKKTMKGGFDDSPLRLNSYMKTVDRWTENAILERTAELSQKALTVWKAEQLSVSFLGQLASELQEMRVTTDYQLSDYEHLTGNMLALFEALDERIRKIDPSVRQECKKLYIAYKASTNFVDVVPQKKRLRLSLNMDFDAIVDPHRIAKDVTDLGRWGNGNVEVGLEDVSELDAVMRLVRQAFGVVG